MKGAELWQTDIEPRLREKGMPRRTQDLRQSFLTPEYPLRKHALLWMRSAAKMLRQQSVFFHMKLLNSAVANAENNLGMNAANLYVAECYAFDGPTMKRIRPRAQGRAYRILKRMSNLKIVLDEKKTEE